MARIVVLGAGVCGLAAAMLLARDRHDVTVLERDPAPVPDTAGQAWEHWSRGGVAQFRQPHYLQPRARHVLDAELPHAVRLRDIARTDLDDPHRFALTWDRVTETELTPWYRATVAVDRARLAEIEAIRTGSERRPATDPAAVLGAALVRAMPHDPDIFRAFMEIGGCLTLPSVVFKRPGLAERVLEVAARHEIASAPGPTREELLRLIA